MEDFENEYVELEYYYRKKHPYEDLDWLDAHEDFEFPFPIEE